MRMVLTQQRAQIKLLEGANQQLSADLAKTQDALAEERKLTTIDALTGAKNRRGFDEDLATALSADKRADKGVVLMVMDLDKFKKINDEHGHPAGDAALIHITQRIRQTLRPGSTVTRFGGDEFAIIMPGTTTEEAAAHIQAITEAVAAKPFQWGGATLMVGGTIIAHDCNSSLSAADNYAAADAILTTRKQEVRAAYQAAEAARAAQAAVPANQQIPPPAPAVR